MSDTEITPNQERELFLAVYNIVMQRQAKLTIPKQAETIDNLLQLGEKLEMFDECKKLKKLNRANRNSRKFW